MLARRFTVQRAPACRGGWIRSRQTVHARSCARGLGGTVVDDVGVGRARGDIGPGLGVHR
jgi:hypothetical protein